MMNAIVIAGTNVRVGVDLLGGVCTAAEAACDKPNQPRDKESRGGGGRGCTFAESGRLEADMTLLWDDEEPAICACSFSLGFQTTTGFG
jgi:hypothetical protein